MVKKGTNGQYRRRASGQTRDFSHKGIVNLRDRSLSTWQNTGKLKKKRGMVCVRRVLGLGRGNLQLERLRIEHGILLVNNLDRDAAARILVDPFLHDSERSPEET
jgi:hypothetical protein